MSGAKSDNFLLFAPPDSGVVAGGPAASAGLQPLWGGGAALLGLSLGQISSHLKNIGVFGDKAVIARPGGGDISWVKRSNGHPVRRQNQGKRGRCMGFSGASRRAMLQTMSLIDRGQVERVWFLTMTGKAFTFGQGAEAFEQIERARKLWESRWRRQWGDQALIVWKKEITKAGTPHLHALVFWTIASPAPKFNAFIRWNDAAWVECAAGAGFDASVKCACRTEALKSWHGVKSYAAKYCAKDCISDVPTGRMWGVVNRGAVTVSIGHRVVPGDVANLVMRTLAKYRERQSEKLSLRWVGRIYEPGQVTRYTPSSARESWWAIHGQRSYPPWAKWDKSIGPWRDDALRWVFRQNSHWRYTRRKRRAHFNHDVKLWSQDVDTGKLEPCGVERHAFASGVTMGVRSSMLDRLVAWAESEIGRRRSCRDALPF